MGKPTSNDIELMDAIMSTHLTRFIWLGAMFITAPDEMENVAKKELLPKFYQSSEYLESSNDLKIGQRAIKKLVKMGFPDIPANKFINLLIKYIK